MSVRQWPHLWCSLDVATFLELRFCELRDYGVLRSSAIKLSYWDRMNRIGKGNISEQAMVGKGV